MGMLLSSLSTRPTTSKSIALWRQAREISARRSSRTVARFRAAAERRMSEAKHIQAERHACEIRLRAERKAGQIEAKREKSKGGRGNREICSRRNKFS